jgi:hypothetical protein
MRIHGLCVVKNEADIIRQTLAAAGRWCDSIYVLDNGSRDETWSIVSELGQRYKCIVPYKQDAQPFSDGIREDIFQEFKMNGRHGDWWCILDADEFYIDDPRCFLEAVPGAYNSVWMKLYVYRFTDRDLDRYQRDPRLYSDEIPVEERLRYYVIGEYAGMRFFRHSDHVRNIAVSDIHPIYPKRIRVKHFAYRSPRQIQLRLDTRREPMLRGDFVHEKRSNWIPGGTSVSGPATLDDLPESWLERVTPSSSCRFDVDGVLDEEEDSWKPPPAPSLIVTFTSRIRVHFKRVRRVFRRLKPRRPRRSGQGRSH